MAVRPDPRPFPLMHVLSDWFRRYFSDPQVVFLSVALVLGFGVVDLHPVAIMVAILVFGGLWGFWGVFFAIPLATLVQAILVAWPRPAGIGAG